MAIFDQIIGGLTGERSLRRLRDQSIQAGRSAYDPNVLNPQIGVAKQQAVQGIDEGMYRRNVVNELFRPVSTAAYGGNQSAAIAGTSAQDMARTRAMGQFESQMAIQDSSVKQAGAERVGQVQSSQLQLQGQRDAYTSQVNAEFEAEKDSRRRQLGTALVGFGIQAAGGPLAIGGAIGNKFASIFGAMGQTPQNLTQAGANMAAERSLQAATEAAGATGFDFASLGADVPLPTSPLMNRLRGVVDRGMNLNSSMTQPSRLPGDLIGTGPVDQFGNITDGATNIGLPGDLMGAGGRDALGNVMDGASVLGDDGPSRMTFEQFQRQERGTLTQPGTAVRGVTEGYGGIPFVTTPLKSYWDLAWNPKNYLNPAVGFPALFRSIQQQAEESQRRRFEQATQGR